MQMEFGQETPEWDDRLHRERAQFGRIYGDIEAENSKKEDEMKHDTCEDW